jgi:NAD-dependent deacetylase
MVVYPAAGLIDYVPKNVPIYLIDPNDVAIPIYRPVKFIKEKAGTGVEQLKKLLLENI